MELYLSVKIPGGQTCVPLITEAAAVVLDDQGHEIAVFETAPGDTDVRTLSEQAAAALLGFIERYPKAILHAVQDETDRALFCRPPWNLGGLLWEECVITAAVDVMERLGAEACRKKGHPTPTLEEASRFFSVRTEEYPGVLAIARLGAQLHIQVRERRAACDLEEDEVTHMMEQGL